MKRDEMNTEFYSELHISDAMVEELVADVKKGKRHADSSPHWNRVVGKEMKCQI